MLSWNHRATADDWWAGPATGVAFLGELLHRQEPDVQLGIRREFDRLAAEFLDADGRLALPHAALLVSAQR
ncbi:hypothetical protein [Kitasatospora cheerisanensis]|uniref:hypothetical protein n=1 Tax=Kitasatospora cheerisanensis TaxID=81942 RepID=UPI000AF61526|nr:hypothetical protein [Kitasatospora cheerisanensis]